MAVVPDRCLAAGHRVLEAGMDTEGQLGIGI